MKKYLVTSGCSFSDNILVNYQNAVGRWPHFLAQQTQRYLINYGYGSAGNDYISNSLIFALNKLINEGIPTEDIIVVVMWSGIDRQGHFISKNETPNFDELILKNHNPVNFINMIPILDQGIYVPDFNNSLTSGWLLGSPSCSWDNKKILNYKKEYFKKFYTYEDCLFRSYDNFLKLQWYCENKKINLINLTFMEILPRADELKKYTTIQHLHNMVDFSKWYFWKELGGLYEYTRDHSLGFYNDNMHPTPLSHKYYVENFLIEKITRLEKLI